MTPTTVRIVPLLAAPGPPVLRPPPAPGQPRDAPSRGAAVGARTALSMRSILRPALPCLEPLSRCSQRFREAGGNPSVMAFLVRDPGPSLEGTLHREGCCGARFLSRRGGGGGGFGGVGWGVLLRKMDSEKVQGNLL